MSTWATKYIGLPYAVGGDGPAAFNCWGFVRYVLAREFKIQVPEFTLSEKALEQTRLIRGELGSSQWERLNDAHDGAVVLLTQNKYPHHVGLWCKPADGLAHCLQGSGVVFHSRNRLKFEGWRIHGHYRLRSRGLDSEPI